MDTNITDADIPKAPLTRGKRTALVLGVIGAVLTILTAIGFAAGWIQIYDAPANAGIVVGVECHNIGYEWRGTPGFFTDSCS